MNRCLSFVFVMVLAGVLVAERASGAGLDERVFYAGGSGDEEFFDAYRLSDGRWVIAGRSTELDWLPEGTPTTTAANASVINSPNTTRSWIGFLLLVSADLRRVEHCWHLPKGASESIRRIRGTEVPGEATGDLYISGNVGLTSWGDTQGGYFVAKLDANFVSSVPTALAWAVTVNARGELKDNQAWDVSKAGGDALLVVITGSPHSADWMSAEFFDGAGQPKSLPSLRAKNPARLVLKTNSTGDFRSWTAEDHAAVTPDTNGGLRRGRWPMDAFFDGPYGLPGNGSGRGYTGYRTSAAAGHISAVVIDRRTNEFYLGANHKTQLPDGNPDFEPWVISYSGTGVMRWWSRLYSEWKDSVSGALANGTIDLDLDSNNDLVLDRSSEGRLSTPDQYVDGLAIDYVHDKLIVNARCHGNNTTNFWNGSAASIPGAPAGYSGFQRQFTGTSGNIHIGWLGRHDLSDGTLRGATYVAGFARGGTVNASATYTDPNLAGWPDVNSGWANLNTTRLRPNRVTVDELGRVIVIGAAPRLATTATAWQALLPPPATSPWHDFVRVYSPGLDGLIYGSALVGGFTYANGATNTEPAGAGGVAVRGVAAAPGGLLVVGAGLATDGVPQGNPMRVGAAPSWARTNRAGADGIVARLELPGSTARTFAAWSTEVLDEPGARADADADADGWPNLLAYALGSPRPAGGQADPGLVVETVPASGGGSRLLLRVRRDPGRHEAELAVEFSSDLVNWSTVATSSAGAPFRGPGYLRGELAGSAVRIVEIVDPAPGTAERRFVRVRATRR